jgi:PAS domain S-box-containing protein
LAELLLAAPTRYLVAFPPPLIRLACVCRQLLPNCPLTYVSNNFCRLTGYHKDECIGTNCRFLQCAETDRLVVKQMGECLRRMRAAGPGGAGSQPKTFRIINAKKDGTRFLSLVQLTPVYSRSGELIRYIGCQFGLRNIAQASLAMQHMFQGTIDAEQIEQLAGKSHADVMSEWTWASDAAIKRPSLELVPGARDQVVAHMQQLLCAHATEVCKLLDLELLSQMCLHVESHIGQKRRQLVSPTLSPVHSATAGPQGTMPPLQLAQVRSKRSCASQAIQLGSDGLTKSRSMSSLK